MFNTVGDILTYAPVYKDYHYQMLQELYDDGIMYVELRTSLHDVSNFAHLAQLYISNASKKASYSIFC
jgi:hypothetical protein